MTPKPVPDSTWPSATSVWPSNRHTLARLSSPPSTTSCAIGRHRHRVDRGVIETGAIGAHRVIERRGRWPAPARWHRSPRCRPAGVPGAAAGGRRRRRCRRTGRAADTAVVPPAPPVVPPVALCRRLPPSVPPCRCHRCRPRRRCYRRCRHRRAVAGAGSLSATLTVAPADGDLHRIAVALASGRTGGADLGRRLHGHAAGRRRVDVDAQLHSGGRVEPGRQRKGLGDVPHRDSNLRRRPAGGSRRSARPSPASPSP